MSPSRLSFFPFFFFFFLFFGPLWPRRQERVAAAADGHHPEGLVPAQPDDLRAGEGDERRLVGHGHHNLLIIRCPIVLFFVGGQVLFELQMCRGKQTCTLNILHVKTKVFPTTFTPDP